MVSQDKAIKFCKSILPKVSRSFALTIPMLDNDLYRPVLIAYLQDRLLDNFEDEIADNDISLVERKQMMDYVVKLFNPDYSSVDDSDIQEAIVNIKKYKDLMPEKSLKVLTDNAELLRIAYDTLEKELKKISFKWLQEMNKGMKKYLVNCVETFDDLDQYCYFVAGTVGGFLTDIVILKGNPGTEDENVLLNNFNISGLFLQKVNIIRDIKKDLENREKHFWPLKELGISEDELLKEDNKDRAMVSLDKMLNDVRGHVPGLVRYYKAIPDKFSGYRKFFCVNNALGLATIDKLENNPDVFYGRKEVKVSRLAFLNIIKNPEKAFLVRSKIVQKEL